MDIVEIIGELEHHMGAPIYDPVFRDYQVNIRVKPEDDAVVIDVLPNVKIIELIGDKTKEAIDE